MTVYTTEFEDKLPVDEGFIAAICEAKRVAITEIEDIAGCFNEDKEKANDHDRKMCNLHHAVEVLYHYVHIHHMVEDKSVAAEVEKAVHKAEMRMMKHHEEMEREAKHRAEMEHMEKMRMEKLHEEAMHAVHAHPAAVMS